jgi:hypothetical protein
MIEKFTVEIEVGDRVEVGRMHLANQTIKAIEVDKWGHPVMVLESGRKRGLFNMRLKNQRTMGRSTGKDRPSKSRIIQCTAT